MLRAPNAYVPPGARRNAGPGNTPARVQATGAPAAAKANGTTSVAPAPSSQPAPPSKSASSTSDATVPPGAKAPAPLAVPAPARSSSDVQPASEKVVDTKPGTLSPQPESAQSANKEEKVSQRSRREARADVQAQPPTSVVDQFRSFVGSEREKVEAKKQSMVKQERERTLADLKKFQTNFKVSSTLSSLNELIVQVPLPMPKDILPLLAKDAEKQKAIEEKAALALEDAKRKPEAAAAKASPSTSQPKKIAMKIPEIPPFKPKVSPNPPTIPVPESASKDIPQATSPTPSAASHASGNLQAKLNPNASSFVFKPNPAAAAFKPGQSSTVTSPASRSAQLQVSVRDSR